MPLGVAAEAEAAPARFTRSPRPSLSFGQALASMFESLGGKAGQRRGDGGVGGDPTRSSTEDGVVEGARLMADQDGARDGAG